MKYIAVVVVFSLCVCNGALWWDSYLLQLLNESD